MQCTNSEKYFRQKKLWPVHDAGSNKRQFSFERQGPHSEELPIIFFKTKKENHFLNISAERRLVYTFFDNINGTHIHNH